MNAVVTAIEYHLPAQVLTNEQLAARFPEWPAEKILAKTGIRRRHIAAVDEFSSDLAEAAAKKLFERHGVSPASIDFLLLCTQTPDFSLPTSACLLQHRLGIPQTAGALDFNLGCSGYVYGISLAKGLVESGQAKRLLFLTGETYSKLLEPNDKSVLTIFGDAGSATLIELHPDRDPAGLGPFVFGTDGSGGENLVCARGGFRGCEREAKGREHLWMNGPEVFNFANKVVPEVIERVLERAGFSRDSIDCYVFHQANRFMLDHLRRKLNLAEERFCYAIEDVGNTVSASIPIALREAALKGRVRPGSRLLLVGFGVGYSWAAGVMHWQERSLTIAGSEQSRSLQT